MQITRSKAQYLHTTILIIVTLFMWVPGSSAVASADMYTDSAHGNDTSGVNRSTATCENWPGGVCSIGSCAHCHDTFDDSICGVSDLMLFAPNDNPTPTPQSDNFCYECHGSGSAQAVTNHTYSKNFGGGTATFTTIYDAFNPASGTTPSSHNLADVLSHAVGRGIGFTGSTNPCLVCHDHHVSQQNYPVTLSGLGGVKTAIRRPADYGSPPTNLWGDEDATSGFNERILDYTNTYQAPYYVGGSNYEPANDGTADGSNLPNFKNFCTIQCHGRQDVYSTERSRNLIKISWANEYLGDQHGKAHSPGAGPDNDKGDTVAPYEDPDEEYNYVLSCTDCHEPHGSPNEWLLRTSVNGKDNIVTDRWEGDWWNFCTACHVLTGGTDTYHRDLYTAHPKCPACHEHGNDPDLENYF